MNHYLATVCCHYESINEAKKIRSCVSWVASIYDCPRPLNGLTIKIMYALEKTFQSGGRFHLVQEDIDRLKHPPKSDDVEAHLLQLLAGTNLRPQELKNLTSSCIHTSAIQPYIKTLPTKFRPQGRCVDLSPNMVGCVTWILRQMTKSTYTIMPQSASYTKKLQMTLRRLVTKDPDKLPMVNLYATRHFWCTKMWKLGASSAWLMDQMSHRSWRTTCMYIHEDSDKKWRDSYSGELPPCADIPRSAASAPCLQEPGTTKQWLDKKRKHQDTIAEEEVEDHDLIFEVMDPGLVHS